MLFRTLIRISPATWLLVLLTPAALEHVQSEVPRFESYPLAGSAVAASTIFFVAPVVAAIAAWDVGRLRRAGWLNAPAVRHRTRRLVQVLGPSLVVSITVIMIVTARATVTTGGSPDVRLVGLALAICFAFSVLGAGLATRLPATAAVPAVLILGYAWMVFPLTVEPMWLRLLNGAWFNCCSVDQTVSGRAFLGAIVVAAGLAATGTLLLSQRRLSQVGAPLVAVALLAGFVGVVSVRGLGPDPVVARSSEELQCAGTYPVVCLWPEHEMQRAVVQESADRLLPAWSSAGLQNPTRFTEDSSAQPEHSAVFYVGVGASLNSVEFSVALATADTLFQCTDGFVAGPVPVPVEAAVALQLVAGDSHQALADAYGPDTVAVAAELAGALGSGPIQFDISSISCRSRATA